MKKQILGEDGPLRLSSTQGSECFLSMCQFNNNSLLPGAQRSRSDMFKGSVSPVKIKSASQSFTPNLFFFFIAQSHLFHLLRF